MPDLKFLTLRQAINTLESCGLKNGEKSRIFQLLMPMQLTAAIQWQGDHSRTHLDKGSVIELTVGMGSRGQAESKEQTGGTRLHVIGELSY